MVRHILVCLFISAPIVAAEHSKAMEGSHQVQAAREKANMERAIAASLSDQQPVRTQQDSDMQRATAASVSTHKQETQARAEKQRQQQEETDMRRAIDASLKHPQPKKSRKWLKWATLAGVSIIGAAAYWYFKDTINSHAQSSYDHLRSLYNK